MNKQDLKKICDHSAAAGIMLCEEFKFGVHKLRFVCLGCRESVVLPEVLWQKARSN